MKAIYSKWRLESLAAAALLFLGATSATTEASGLSAMATGGLTSQPIGHYDFCKTYPRECSIRPHDRKPLTITNDVWAMVVNVNKTVNDAVKPMTDFDIYGKEEVWAYPDQGVGDCEDYVLEKRRELMKAGVSLANLLITVVRKPDGDGHAVLTLRTDQGDFVLDNLNDRVIPWYETGYTYLKRQSISHTGRWVTLREDQNMLVGSVE